MTSENKEEIEMAVEMLETMSPTDRLEVFHHFCKHCGKNDPQCWCMADD